MKNNFALNKIYLILSSAFFAYTLFFINSSPENKGSIFGPTIVEGVACGVVVTCTNGTGSGTATATATASGTASATGSSTGTGSSSGTCSGF